jgi:hypothetical protein
MFVNLGRGNRFIFSAVCSLALGLTQPCIHAVPGAKQPEPEADHSPLIVLRLIMDEAMLLLLHYAFMALHVFF